MKLLFRLFGYSLLMFSGVVGSAFAATENLEKTIYSSAYMAEKNTTTLYYQQATKGFTKKLNIALKQNPSLKKISDQCGGCDVFSETFDDYLATHLYATDVRAGWVGKIDTKVSLLQNASSEESTILNRFIITSLVSVREQAKFLASTHSDLESPGAYGDENIQNSPFDLVNDQQKIAGLFMKEPPQYEGYTNTMKQDASGLITGQFQTGSWAQGTQYEIDLASDIASALGQGEGSSSTGSSDSSGSDCESGFCITVDFITSDSYSASSRGGGSAFVDANLEEIFGSANDWLIKKGDKRNIACKTPPPHNQFQSNNDLNLFFKNIFRGLGIFVFKKTPPYAKPDVGSQREKTPLQKEKETDSVINNSLKNYNVDPEHLMLGTIRQSVEGAAPGAPTYVQTARNMTKAIEQYEAYQKAKQNSGSIERKAIGIESSSTMLKNDFRTLKSQIDASRAAAKDLETSMAALRDKPDCMT